MGTIKTIVVSCPLCGSGESRQRYWFADKGIGVVTCERCGLVFTSPRLADDCMSREVYSEAYFRGDPDHKLGGDFAERENIFRTKFRHDVLPRLESAVGRKGRLLDVGCAIGILVDEAAKNGWDAAGIELSEFAAEHARREYGIDVRAETLENCSFEEGSFDAITLMSVLEHLAQPVDALRKVAGLLRPGGVLMVEVPDFECRDSRRRGMRWPLLSPREHLVHYSRKTLGPLLERSGFRVEDVSGGGGAGILDVLSHGRLSFIRSFTVRYARQLDWLRRILRRIRHAVSGPRTIVLLARKVT